MQYFHISFYEPAPTTLSGAEDLLQRSHDLVADVRADLTAQGLGSLVAADVPTFERSVQIARQAEDNVFVSILPLALISVLVGCAGLGTVALQWYQRRHAQLRLLSARGSGPAALGGLAVAELGLPILLGGAAGAAAARLLLRVYGPDGAPDPAAELRAGAVAAGTLLVSLALLALVVAVRVHREFELGRVRRKGNRARLLGYFPWELATAGMAWLGWNRLTHYGTASRLGNPLPQVDPLALTYPVFVVLTVGLLTARLAWLALHASHRARFWSRPALQLAIRRLAGARAPVTGVLVIGTLAIGTLATGIGIADGQEEALDTKSAIFVGSNARLDTDSPIGMGDVAMPASLAGTSTVVGELTGTGSVVLVVDPATFTQGAAVGPRARPATSANCCGKISQPDPRGTPVIRVGHTAKQTTQLPDGLRDAVTVGDLPVFPMIGTSPGYVVSRTVLDHAQLDGVPEVERADQRVDGGRDHRAARRGRVHPEPGQPRDRAGRAAVLRRVVDVLVRGAARRGPRGGGDPRAARGGRGAATAERARRRFGAAHGNAATDTARESPDGARRAERAGDRGRGGVRGLGGRAVGAAVRPGDVPRAPLRAARTRCRSC